VVGSGPVPTIGGPPPHSGAVTRPTGTLHPAAYGVGGGGVVVAHSPGCDQWRGARNALSVVWGIYECLGICS